MKIAPWMAVACLALSVLDIQGEANYTPPHSFQFRTPQRVACRLPSDAVQASAITADKTAWLKARLDDGSTNTVELGSRVVLQLRATSDLNKLTAGRPLELSRVVASNIFILQAPDALTAAREADRLAALPEVLACYPVMRRQAAPHGPYAARSNDPFAIPFFSGQTQTYDAQWPIENRDGYSTRLGLDLNILAAWPYTLGHGVTVAIADSGLEMNHPELTNQLASAPHFNFDAQSATNAGPYGGDQSDPNKAFWTHGTSVAGLIGAEGNNGRGMIGVAPHASLASWLIYTTNAVLVSDERLMDVYLHASETVSVQNHSWGAGNGLKQQRGPTLLEQIGIENAVTLGRDGLGTVMVRSAGNDRSLVASANDDGYLNDPQVITVAAVTKTGRATSYSEPGACVLVGAPGGGGDQPQGLFTLDLVGTRGVTSIYIFGGDLNDYNFGVQGFIGTSGSAPLLSGIAALILSANTNLSYRDVQQILLLSARHWDLADPDLSTNGAGLMVSHNVGFGVPDAGHAIRLARAWSNRPPLVTFAVTNNEALPVPDEGLRVEVSGSDIPPALVSIPAFPTFAPHADDPTPALLLVDVGVATNVPAVNLTNKGALILRDATPFETKIANAAQAGAAYAIIYHSTNGGDFNLGLVSGTDYSPIPAVFIGHSSGEGLKALFQTNATALARLRLLTADKMFQVNSTLLCEHVGVRVQTDHPLRGDLRITLRSPQGTRSALQHFNDDTEAGPTDWTYWSTHHFLESSFGDWTASFSDEFVGDTGSVHSVSLIIRGTQITDSDRDGLDDGWETSRLSTLAYGPQDDPDSDGFSNTREQVMGTDPQASDILAAPDLSRWGLFGSSFMRLSWPSAPRYNYEIRGGTNVSSLSVVTNLPGGFPETEFFVPFTASQDGFFKVRAFQAP